MATTYIGRAWRITLAGALVAGATALTLPSAQAATGSQSTSSAQFLDAGVLGGDVSGVAGIDGAQASYVDGTTSGTSTVVDAPLDLTALSALTVPLPSTVTLGSLLDLGVVTQHAVAQPDGVSSSHTETADLGLNLNSLLGSVPALSGVIDTAGLDLGAVGSTASVNAADPSSLTRTTEIANANLTLHSPAIATLTGTVNTTAQTLSTALDTVTSTLDTGLATLLEPVPGATVSIDNNLAAAVAPLVTQTISANGVSIDLATGTISINLALLQDADGNPLLNLNDLPPNSTLLSPAVLQNISGQVSSLLTSLQRQINDIVDNALDHISVDISGSAGGVTLAYHGSLGDLITTSPNIATGSGLAQATATLINTGLDALLTTAGAAANTAIAVSGDAIDGAVTTATDVLAPALEALTDVVAVNLNVQNGGDGIATQADVTAVQVTLLPNGSAVTLNLATSTVGPNTLVTYDPTLSASSPAPSGGATTVTGTGWPPSTQVTLQLTDPDGADVGQPVTVTTDADGNLPAGTTVPIPPGATPGTGYTVTGTTADGLSRDATLAVTDGTPPAVAITSPADGTVSNDTTPTITGTSEPGVASVQVVITDAGDPSTVVYQGPATVAANGDWTIGSGVLPEGSYTITATAADAAGNTATDSIGYTVDLTPPAVTIETPTTGQAVRTTDRRSPAPPTPTRRSTSSSPTAPVRPSTRAMPPSTPTGAGPTPPATRSPTGTTPSPRPRPTRPATPPPTPRPSRSTPPTRWSTSSARPTVRRHSSTNPWCPGRSTRPTRPSR